MNSNKWRNYLFFNSIKYLYPLLFVCSTAFAFDISDLLSGDEPEGIVFDINSGDEMLLQSLLPDVLDAIADIRKMYPGMAIAIVTHGDEQFGLLSKHRNELPSIHAQVQDLVTREEVDVHVCGTYAGFHNYTDEDFPDYVDVAAAGPAQVADYRALGYSIITLP